MSRRSSNRPQLRYTPPPRSQAEKRPKRGLTAKSQQTSSDNPLCISAPSLPACRPPKGSGSPISNASDAWREKVGDQEVKRESSSYRFEHKEGYGGHLPVSARNRGKYGKTLNNHQYVGAVQAEVITSLPMRKELIGATPRSRSETALSPPAASRSQPSLATSRTDDAARRKSSAYDFAHKEGYMGHKPVSARNQSKYGKTFGAVDKLVESERVGRSLPGAAPPSATLDRLGRGVEHAGTEDPRPPRLKAECTGPFWTGYGPVPRMWQKIEKEPPPARAPLMPLA